MGRLTDRPDMTMDVYRGRKTTPQHQTKIYKTTVKQTYTQTMSRDMTAAPITTNTQSVINPEPSPSTRTTFLHYLCLPRIKSLRKQGTGTILSIHNMIYNNECSERVGVGGRGLGGTPMEGMFVEMDRGGGRVLTHGKRQSMCVLTKLNFSC